MLPVLEAKFNQIENTRALFVRPLTDLSEAVLAFRPAENRWSILEVLEHLILAEERSNQYVLKKLPELHRLKKLGMASHLRSGLLTLMLRTPFRFKAPSNKVIPATASPASLTDLKERWDATRTQLHIILDEFIPEMLKYPVFRHPLAGPLTILQMLRFCDEHIRHHRRQVHRILKCARKVARQ